LAQYERRKIPGEYEVMLNSIVELMKQTSQGLLKPKNQMVRPRTSNALLKDGENCIRMETHGEQTDRKTKNKMAG
jgi:hypothetical protein